jgi:hypothetical protein
MGVLGSYPGDGIISIPLSKTVSHSMIIPYQRRSIGKLIFPINPLSQPGVSNRKRIEEHPNKAYPFESALSGGGSIVLI